MAETNPKAQQTQMQQEPNPNEGLVLVVKGDQRLYVHPTTVDAHRAAGWVVP